MQMYVITFNIILGKLYANMVILVSIMSNESRCGLDLKKEPIFTEIVHVLRHQYYFSLPKTKTGKV